MKEYLDVQLGQSYDEAAGRSSKKTAQALHDLGNIIESNGIMDTDDLEVSRLISKPSRYNTQPSEIGTKVNESPRGTSPTDGKKSVNSQAKKPAPDKEDSTFLPPLKNDS